MGFQDLEGGCCQHDLPEFCIQRIRSDYDTPNMHLGEIAMEEKNTIVPAVERALNIIEFIGFKKNNATVKDISDGLNIPMASAARIVKVLTLRGYLAELKGASSTFSLSLKILHLSQAVVRNTELVSLARKHMCVLSEETNQTSQLAILQQGSVIYIEQVLPPKSVSIIAPLHTPIALNTSASGKVLCAWSSKEQQRLIIEAAELVKASEHSIVNKKLFYKELERVRAEGYGMDNEEFAVGIGCIAAPIFDYTGEIIAAVGITGHIAAYRDRVELQKLTEALHKAALGISTGLGFGTET